MTAIPIATTECAPTRPTRIEVALVNGHARVLTLAHGNLLAARPLHVSGCRARIALVGINTALLAGDRLEINVHVGAGVHLEVIEPTGLVAYNAEGRRADWCLNARVDAGATLAWHGAPFVAAQGSDAHRHTDLALAADARALLRETLVLGRSGESDIRLHSRINASHGDQPLLVEALQLDAATASLPGIVAPARVIATVMALGWRPTCERNDPHHLNLAGPGALMRTLESAMHHADARLEPVFGAWHRQLPST